MLVRADVNRKAHGSPLLRHDFVYRCPDTPRDEKDMAVAREQIGARSIARAPA
jgi:hypothetical protein